MIEEQMKFIIHNDCFFMNEDDYPLIKNLEKQKEKYEQKLKKFNDAACKLDLKNKSQKEDDRTNIHLEMQNLSPDGINGV